MSSRPVLTEQEFWRDYELKPTNHLKAKPMGKSLGQFAMIGILFLMLGASAANAATISQSSLGAIQTQGALNKQIASLMERVDTVFIGEYTGECRELPLSASAKYDFFFEPKEILKGSIEDIANVRIRDEHDCPSSSFLTGRRYLVLAEKFHINFTVGGIYDPADFYTVNKYFVIPLDK